MRKAIAILIGSVSLIFALHNGLYAQIPEAIGTITFMEGISDIVRNNQEPLFVNEHQPIYVNDRIRTKSYSKMEITFADKSVLRLAPGTCVSIEEYRLNDKKIRELAHISLTRGKIETIVSKTGAPDTFLIDTPNAKGAVKGSDIFISYLGGRTGVFAQEGAISVLNPSSPDMKTRVTKGNCVFIPFNEVPGEMRLVRDSEVTYFKRSVEPEFIKKWIPSKGSTQMNAVLVSISGDVRFYRKGASDWREAKMNETLSEGDKIQTGDDGMAQIRLSNGNSIMLQRNAELGFATLR
ncbi:MAG: FecR family protein, partial [bacterium]